MAKNMDIPSELNEFWKVFEKLAYRHSYEKVFDDFLTITMAFFTVPGMMKEEHETAMKGYTQDEKALFNQLFQVFILTLDKEIGTRKWVDLLGALYEAIAGNLKKSSMGQFFTPETIVDLMIQLQYSEDMTGKGLRVNDPACGSGRTLIAFHAHAPGNYTYGEDLDLMCCKMACINMMVHGCEGEVIWHDSLMPEDYKGGWKINSGIRHTRLPSIIPMTIEESSLYQYKEEIPAVKEEAKLIPQEKKETNNKTTNINTGIGLQLSIF